VTTTTATSSSGITIHELIRETKEAARGREVDVLVHVGGIPAEKLDGKHHPCPSCGGEDRFSLVNHERGAVLCRHCFSEKNGDFIAAVAHFRGITNRKACDLILGYLGRRSNCAATTPSTSPRCATKSTEKKSNKLHPNLNGALKALEWKFGRPQDGMWEYLWADRSTAGWTVRFTLDEIDEKTGKHKKEFAFISKVEGGWRNEHLPEPRPLFHLPDLANATRVYVCEGEKAAEAARSIGLVVTTWIGGSSVPGKADWSPLAGKEVVFVPDNDDPGEKCCAEVLGIVSALSTPAKPFEARLPNLALSEDIFDWIEAQGEAATPEVLAKSVEGFVKPVEPIAVSRSPKGMEPARNEFQLIPSSELGGGEQVNWVWDGYLAKGYITLLIGLWKAGKSTLISHFLRASEAGGSVAGEVQPCRVAVITEEGQGLWARRRDDVGLGENVLFSVRPFKGRPTHLAWQAYVDWMAAKVKSENITAVIIDTWQSVSPCDDENDAAGMMQALGPLHRITEAGAAVLIVHHPKKGDAAEGQACRGSGALPGFVDIILEFRRFNAESPEDKRRKIKSHSRFDETPPEAVIELTPTGYRFVGTNSEAKQSDRFKVIEEILSQTDWLTSDGIHGNWPAGDVPCPGQRTVDLDAKKGAEQGRWIKEGTGKRGDPFRYQFVSRTLPPLRACANSEMAQEEETF
jgi:hypothetical protein